MDFLEASDGQRIALFILRTLGRNRYLMSLLEPYLDPHEDVLDAEMYALDYMDSEWWDLMDDLDDIPDPLPRGS